MSLKPRERWTIIGGALVAALAVYFRSAGGGAAGAASANTLNGALERIRQFETTSATLTKLCTDLKVTLPTGSPGEQELAMRQQLAQAVQQNGLKLSDMQRGEAAGRRDAQFKPLVFRMDVSGNFDSVMGLVYQLEHAPTPYVVDELTVSAPSGGGGGNSGGGGRSRSSSNEGSNSPPPMPSQPSGPPPGMSISFGSGGPGGMPGSISLPPGVNLPPEALAAMARAQAAAQRSSSRDMASASGSGSSSSRRSRSSTSSRGSGSSSSSSSSSRKSSSSEMPSSGPPPSMDMKMMTSDGGSRGGGVGSPGGGAVTAKLTVQGHIFPAQPTPAPAKDSSKSNEAKPAKGVNLDKPASSPNPAASSQESPNKPANISGDSGKKPKATPAEATTGGSFTIIDAQPVPAGMPPGSITIMNGEGIEIKGGAPSPSSSESVPQASKRL